MKNKSTLVIFGEEFPQNWVNLNTAVEIIVAKENLRQKIERAGLKFISLESLIEPGSIYEATSLVEELSLLKMPEGSRLSKSFFYKGYELWWVNYNSLYLHYCLPFTQYKKLLNYLKDFESVCFYDPPHKKLFSCYLDAYGCKVSILKKPGLKSPSLLPFGVFLQILITLVCIPILILRQPRTMIFIGDKFEEGKDHDFRMRFIYEELRKRNIPFIEFIRSLESWKMVLEHAWKRGRPVIYSEAIFFIGRFLSFVFRGNVVAKRKFNTDFFSSIKDSESRFKFLIASQYISSVGVDIWTIKIMDNLIRMMGLKAVFIAAAIERNFHTVLGCKLNKIPITGILHGFASRYYNGYDFLPTYDGEKSIQVDKYGLWSEWWKEYYSKYSKTHKKENLYVSGPMRPFVRDNAKHQLPKSELLRVLFISEQLSVPEEVIPYLQYLLAQEEIELTIKFRPSRDGFEQWLLKNNPQILKDERLKIIRGTMQEAIQKNDIVVGNNSTAVIEALLDLKPIVLYHSNKWGDYFELEGRDESFRFFARSPEELLKCIRDNQNVPKETLEKLQEQFFGDPYKNGSEWAVDQLEEVLKGWATR